MHRCDVLIVGGGPAGASLAWSLRGSGLSVTVMDSKHFPRDKICAGWVTPEVLATLDIDPRDYQRERVMQPITGFRVGLFGRRQVEIKYAGAPVSYGIRRFEFDHYLLDRCGAHLLLGAPLRSMERDGLDWLVNGDLRARLVVGAGGHFCPVARTFDDRPPGREMLVAAQEIEFEMTPAQQAACRVDPEVPELFFEQDLNGYGWIFRKGNWLNIGLGREDKQNLSGHMEAFRKMIIGQGKVPADIPTRFKGHAYLLYHHAKRELVGDGMMLIGDSAGLAYPESGEGIRPAVESALLAAAVIRSAGGDYGSARLGSYRDLMEERFGSRQPKPGLLERLPLGIKRKFAIPLMQTKWFMRKVLVERWFLHRGMTPLPPPDGRIAQ